MVLAHVTPTSVRLLQSADVSWCVVNDAGTTHESRAEPGFAEFEARNKRDVAELAQGAGFAAAQRDIYRKTRAMMNVEGGYPVVQYGMDGPLAVVETVIQANDPHVILHSGGWPKLLRGGLDARLLGEDGFDDVTSLHVRALG